MSRNNLLFAQPISNIMNFKLTVKRKMQLILMSLGLASLFISDAVFANCTGASPTWTSTVDYSSLSSCVSQAQAGDTINVSAGTATYSSTLHITKPLQLVGAGETSTVINGNGVNVISVEPSSGDTRISGFGFTGSGGTTGLHNALLKFGGSGGGTWQSMRLDHCQFTDITTISVLIGEWHELQQHPKMLMDHITYTNTNAVNFSQLAGHDSTWKLADQYGTDFAIFIEDSSFSYSTPNFYNILTDTEYGVRMVIRHNILNNTSIQMHDTGSTQGSKGQRLTEIYENNFTCSGTGCSSYNATGLRGGGYIVYNNTISSSIGTAWPQIWRALQQYNGGFLGGRCGTGVSACDTLHYYHCSGGDHRACSYPNDYVCSGLGSCVVAASSQADCPVGVTFLPNVDNVNGGNDPSGWPCRNQTGWGQESTDGRTEESSPVYWYNNKNEKGLTVTFENSNSQPTWFKQNRDYCYHDPSTACGAKAGWAYTPYTYPHPLQTASSNPPTVSPPSNLQIIP